MLKKKKYRFINILECINGIIVLRCITKKQFLVANTIPKPSIESDNINHCKEKLQQASQLGRSLWVKPWEGKLAKWRHATSKAVGNCWGEFKWVQCWFSWETSLIPQIEITLTAVHCVRHWLFKATRHIHTLKDKLCVPKWVSILGFLLDNLLLLSYTNWFLQFLSSVPPEQTRQTRLLQLGGITRFLPGSSETGRAPLRPLSSPTGRQEGVGDDAGGCRWVLASPRPSGWGWGGWLDRRRACGGSTWLVSGSGRVGSGWGGSMRQVWHESGPFRPPPFSPTVSMVSARAIWAGAWIT